MIDFEHKVIPGEEYFVNYPIWRIQLLRDNRHVLGFSDIHVKENSYPFDHLHLHHIGIKKRLRGKRLGGKLLGEVMNFVDEYGLPAITRNAIDVTMPQHFMYESYGWKRLNNSPEYGLWLGYNMPENLDLTSIDQLCLNALIQQL
jgi:ribosomal protein S18 acetylase RimI-like enzyme